MDWNGSRMFMSSLLMAALSLPASAIANDSPVNLNMTKGTRLTADSVLGQFTADKAADGNNTDKPSRWVSNGEPVQHWLAADFGKTVSINNVTLKFWNDSHIAVDFDLQKKDGDGWKTFKTIRKNSNDVCNYTFPTISTTALRVLFLKTIPDNMVRIYEFSAYELPCPMAMEMSSAFSQGLLLAGKKPEIILHNYQNKPENLSVVAKLLYDQADHYEIAVTKTGLKLGASATIALPVPPDYGAYRYQIKIDTQDGRNIINRETKVFYFPPSTSKYVTSSPFGAHYYNASETLVRYAGMYWWRNHDVYGRWNYYADEKGKEDWKGLQDKLDFVSDNRIRECFVFLGAPLVYSTILPGEKCESDKSWLYSYYPPSDLNAWIKKYLLPVAAMVKKAAPFRAYEIWNEAWSYYRLRGLHGTAGEAFELFKVSYEALKKADPQALVYSTDVKPEASDNRYAFKSFGRDLLDLGYLRYNDLLSYHGYGMADYKNIERIRKNAWDYARDLELWSTETAVEGRPYFELMKSLVIHRASGNGKTFIYNGISWAPLMTNGAPTMYLVVQASLIRTLGDALFLGKDEIDGISRYLFVNGSQAVAVLFTDSVKPVKINVPLTADSLVLNVFGRKLNPQNAILSQAEPLTVINPSPAFVKAVLVKQVETYAAEAVEDTTRSCLKTLATALAATPNNRLKADLAGLEKDLWTKRQTGSTDFLYSSNKVLDLLVNAHLMLARRDHDKVAAPASIDAMRRKLDGQWQAVVAKSGNNGALLNTERLTSRAQKLIQFAMMYDDDGDNIARDLMLAAAAADLDNAAKRLPQEKITAIYKTKTYFRSHKRSLRSELFCFPNDRWQEAVITLANPFGKQLNGNLVLTLPAGWQAKQAKLAYRVEPTSRLLINIQIKAPVEFKSGQIDKIVIKDESGNFPTISAQCEIVKAVPPCPVLVGELISKGKFTGN